MDLAGGGLLDRKRSSSMLLRPPRRVIEHVIHADSFYRCSRHLQLDVRLCGP